MTETNVKQAAVAVLAGAMVGAAVALLFAPQSGARTRKDVKQFARKTVDRLDDVQGDIRDRVTDWIDNMSEIIKDHVDRGNPIGTEGYERVLRGFDNVKKCVEDGRSRIEQLIKAI